MFGARGSIFGFAQFWCFFNNFSNFIILLLNFVSNKVVLVDETAAANSVCMDQQTNSDEH